MKRRVIIDLPKGQSGLEVKMKNLRAGLGFNANTMPWPIMAGKMSEPDLEVNSTLKPVPRDEANLEAEKGEVAALPTKSGIPDVYKISGKRHTQGGTPLNLPTDSFIFSDTPKMRIKDKVVLAQFGMPENKIGYTPAEIAKKYDISAFKKILLDKKTDKLQKQTAETMIANYNLKLAKLALVQESMKGFPQGIPAIAMPYIESMEINPEEFVQMNPGQGDAGAQQEEAGSTMAYGGDVNYFEPGGSIKPPVTNKSATSQFSMPGFGNDTQAASAFQKQYPDYYNSYVAALKSNDPKKMRAIANELQNKDVSYSVGWLPWTDQDKFQDLAGILEEQAAKIEQPVKKYSSFQDKDEETAKKAEDLYAYYVRTARKMDKTSPEYLQILAAKDEAFKHTKAYKNLPSQFSGAKNQWEVPIGQGMFSDMPIGRDKEARMYSDDEIQKINEVHNSLYSPTKNNLLPKGDSQKAGVENIKTVEKSAEEKSAEEALTGKKTEASSGSTQAKQYRVVQSNEDFALGGSTGKKRVVIEYATGGELRKAADGDAGKTITDEYDELNKSGTKQRHVIVYSDGTVSKGTPIDVNAKVSTSEEQRIRQEKAASKPDTVVSKEDYAELMDLYKKGEEANAKNPGKPNSETLKFQKRYHEILGDEAQRIISADPEKTTKGKKEGLAWYDLKSNEDGIFGRRTKQYLEGLGKYKPKDADDTTPVNELPPLEKEKEKPKTIGPEGVIVSHGDVEKEKQYPPIQPAWWLQDKLKALNAGLNYAGIKAYNPYVAQASYITPQTSYLSPERALAENQSQMNTAVNALAQFTGPQQFNARLNEIAGKSFANAANVIADVHNRNIALFNQNEIQKANIKNTEARERAAGATNLWDKYQTVRQNFDTAKANARDVLANTIIQGITNRANTYNLNQMYPQFAVNPGAGGTLFFHDPKDLKPSQAATPISQRYQQMMKDNPTLAASEEGQKRLWEMTKIEAGMPADDYMAEYQRSRQRGAGNQTPIPGYGSTT